jgi:hypothetical protein
MPLAPIPLQIAYLQTLNIGRTMIRCWWTFALIPPLWALLYSYRKRQDEVEFKKIMVRDSLGLFFLWLTIVMMFSRSAIFDR